MNAVAKMTKAAMIAEIDAITQEYLGHPFNGMGPSSWPAARLTVLLNGWREMIAYKRQARAIEAQHPVELWRSMWHPAIGTPEQRAAYVEAGELEGQANRIWATRANA